MNIRYIFLLNIFLIVTQTLFASHAGASAAPIISMINPTELGRCPVCLGDFTPEDLDRERIKSSREQFECLGDHLFHTTCLEQYLATSPARCPVCRAKKLASEIVPRRIQLVRQPEPGTDRLPIAVVGIRPALWDIVKKQLISGDELDLSRQKMSVKELGTIIDALPLNIRQRITGLTASSNPLKTLPNNIALLSHLQTLNASNSQIEYLPASIGDLAHLRELRLHDNLLENLPDEIGRLRELSYLDIHRNRLRQLPETVGDLGNMRELYADQNLLRALPRRIVELGNLQILIVGVNNLTSLPEDIDRLAVLQRLSIENNKIEELPHSLWRLANLTHLAVEHNLIRTISDDIKLLHELAVLSIDNNIITELPIQIGQLPKLQSLHVDDQQKIPKLKRTTKVTRIMRRPSMM